KLSNFLPKLENVSGTKELNVAILTSMNDESGISVYSKETFSNVESSFKNFYYFSNSDISDRTSPDSENIIRNWNVGEESFETVIEDLKKFEISIMHIQYHSSGNSFSPESLDKLIQILDSLKIKCFITFHALRGDTFDLSIS